MKGKSITKQILEGGIWGGFANLLNRLGSMVFIILLARFLFPENFGIYSLTMSIAFLFMMIADLGIDETLVRYISRGKSEKRKAGYFQYLFKIKLFLSIIVSFLLLATAYPISFLIYKKPELFMPLVFSSLFILSTLFVNFLISVIYGVKKTKYVWLKEILAQLIKFGLTILVFVLISSTYYILGIITGLIITNIIIAFFLFFLIKKLKPFLFQSAKENINKKEIIKFLSYITVAILSGVFFTYVDALILGLYVSFSYIGYYKVASSFVFGAIGLFGYLGIILLPIFVGLEKKELREAFNKLLRFLLIFSVPMAFGILALGKYFIKILYGSDYLPAKIPLYVLSFLLISYTPSFLISTTLFSKGKPKHVAKINNISLILNVILNFILISALFKISELWAITGAAIATIFSRYFLFFFLARTARRTLNFRIKKMIFIKPIFAGLLMFASLYWINNRLIENMTLLTGLVEIILGALIYFIIMFLIKGITLKDLKFIKNIM